MAEVAISIAISTALSVGIGLLQRAMTKDQVFDRAGSRLLGSQITGASEGTPVPRVYGKMRVGGELIWATRYLEEAITTTTVQGGKGGPTATTNETDYFYSCSFAVGLCEGEAGVTLGGVWFDGTPIDISTLNYRFYDGRPGQPADPKIRAVEGANNTPAYRGLCYIVFEDLPLADYGNRIPQVKVEIARSLTVDTATSLDSVLRSVNMLPGVGEHDIATEVFTFEDGEGNSEALNVHTFNGQPDIAVSLDALERDAPNLHSASLVVSWFGSSLKSSECTIRPKVDNADRTTLPSEWRVSDRVRSTAELVATNVRGTPSDVSVRQAVAEIKARGLRAMFYPTLWMDFTEGFSEPASNGVVPEAPVSLDDVNYGHLYSHAGETVLYRDGVISTPLAPSVGQAHSADVFLQTNFTLPLQIDVSLQFRQVLASSSQQRESLYIVGGFGSPRNPSSSVDLFSGFNGTTSAYDWVNQTASVTVNQQFDWIKVHLGIGYTGEARNLSIRASSFGSPWRGRVKGDSALLMGTAVPANFGAWDGTAIPYSGPDEWTQRRMVLHYARLLSDVLTSGDAFLVGSEMLGVSQTDSTWGAKVAALIADVKTLLPAGVLVSYAADWREYREPALDAAWTAADFIGIDNFLPLTDWRDGDENYTLDHFKAGVEGGEFYNYEYLSDADRDAGVQTPILTAADRQKDIRNWRIDNHSGKPVWFTAFGCPAVDKGANQPSAFYDQRLVESAFPRYSNGTRNDTVQRLYLEAMLNYWGDGDFIDPKNMFVWTWDARPYPTFPNLTEVWPDAPSWERGHWISGRIGAMTLGRLVTTIMTDAGMPESEFDVTALDDSGIQIAGMGVFDVTSPRDVLENLMGTYSFDAIETGTGFKFVMRVEADEILIDLDDLVMSSDSMSYEKPRRQDTDLPDRTKLTYVDEARDFAPASVDGHVVTGFSTRVNSFTTRCVLPTDYARALADILTQEEWTQKNAARFALPMNYLRIEPGDTFDAKFRDVTRKYRVTGVTMGDQLEIEAVGYSPTIYRPGTFRSSVPKRQSRTGVGSPLLIVADIPLVSAEMGNPWSPRLLTTQNPWPGGVRVFEDDGSGGYDLNTTLTAASVIGETVQDLGPGITDVWDTDNTLVVRLYDTTRSLSSVSDIGVLNGKNALALRTPSGEWEIIQFVTATLNPDGTYSLTRLLRGLLGTEPYMGSPTPAGSRMFLYTPTTFNHLRGTEDRFGLDFDLRYGPLRVSIADARYKDTTITARGVAYRPYSPVHLTQENSSGDLVLSWIRRTRFGGDPWVNGEVPLSEESERYEVEITGGRVIEVVGTTSVTYTLSQQIEDFGSAQASVTWTVYQMSDIFGRGAPANG